MVKPTPNKFIVDPLRRPTQWLVWSAGLVTIFFWTNANDPFNAPKSWILSISGFWLIGWLAFQIKPSMQSSTLKISTILAGLFLLALTIAWIGTDNKFIGFFGEYQRKTGFLTYLCLIAFFLAAAYLINLRTIQNLRVSALFIGFVLWFYGLIQHLGKDPIRWNNPYNAVLGTLGNPDFAAAVMGIFAIINFGIAIQSNLKIKYRLAAAINVVLLFAVIKFSQVRQGILVATLGITLVIIVWIYQQNKKFAFLLISATGTAGILSVLGMLKIGPLTGFFYKASVTYRGDYWRAGWRMFSNHPFFGVGLDRYGANFRYYRDETQSIRRGPDLVSNAAHNVPIQLAATGGILLLIIYLILVIFIAWRGFVAIRKSTGTVQLTVAGIYGAWLAYQAQSIISIDNIGIAIWGYVLGGSVIGLSCNEFSERQKVIKSQLLQPVISLCLTALMIITTAFFFQGEKAMHTLRGIQIPKNETDFMNYQKYLDEPLRYKFKEPNFELTIATIYAQTGRINESLNFASDLVKSDPKSYEANQLLAQIYEYKGDWTNALVMREKLNVLDPYNPNNLAKLNEAREKANR